MDSVTLPGPVATEVIRTPVSGPEPLNVLAFVRCSGGGADIAATRVDTLFAYRVHFLSKFLIDGFAQANIDWYRANTFVSATAFVQMYNATDDTSFVFAIDAINPFIDLTGALGFEVDLAQLFGGAGLFSGTPEISFTTDVSAYVLLFEPQKQMPRFGGVRRVSSPALQPSQPWTWMPSTKMQDFKPADRARLRVTAPPRDRSSS